MYQIDKKGYYDGEKLDKIDSVVFYLFLAGWIVYNVYLYVAFKIRNNQIEKKFGKPWRQEALEIKTKGDEDVDGLYQI